MCSIRTLQPGHCFQPFVDARARTVASSGVARCSSGRACRALEVAISFERKSRRRLRKEISEERKRRRANLEVLAGESCRGEALVNVHRVSE